MRIPCLISDLVKYPLQQDATMRYRSVCDRVYAVGGPDITGGDDCCVYLVDCGADLALIDAGLGRSVDKILRNVQSAGYEPYCIKYIIATHCHIDHIGGIAPIVNLYGPKVIAHELDRRGIEEVHDELTAADLYGIEYTPTKVDVSLKGEHEVIRIGDLDFHMIHTPGHTPGSISPFIETKDGRVLFGQDIHGPFSPRWGSDLARWRESMAKLLSLNIDVLCEGHAGVYRGEKARRYIESYLRRYGQSRTNL